MGVDSNKFGQPIIIFSFQYPFGGIYLSVVQLLVSINLIIFTFKCLKLKD